MPHGRPQSDSYDDAHTRIVSEKPKRVIKSIIPSDEADARQFLGAANKVDAPTSVKEHFATCVRGLGSDE